MHPIARLARRLAALSLLAGSGHANPSRTRDAREPLIAGNSAIQVCGQGGAGLQFIDQQVEQDDAGVAAVVAGRLQAFFSTS